MDGCNRAAGVISAQPETLNYSDKSITQEDPNDSYNSLPELSAGVDVNTPNVHPKVKVSSCPRTSTPTADSNTRVPRGRQSLLGKILNTQPAPGENLLCYFSEVTRKRARPEELVSNSNDGAPKKPRNSETGSPPLSPLTYIDPSSDLEPTMATLSDETLDGIADRLMDRIAGVLAAAAEKQTIQLQQFKNEIAVEMKKDRDHINEQLKDIKENAVRAEAEWISLGNRVQKVEEVCSSGGNMAERTALMREAQRLRTWISNQERIKRKNNIVISGLPLNGEDIMRDVESFLSTHFNVSKAVEKAFLLRGKANNVLVSLVNWEVKLQITRSKKDVLGSEKIYINHDLSEFEREIDNKLVEIARKERALGGI